MDIHIHTVSPSLSESVTSSLFCELNDNSGEEITDEASTQKWENSGNISCKSYLSMTFLPQLLYEYMPFPN